MKLASLTGIALCLLLIACALCLAADRPSATSSPYSVWKNGPSPDPSYFPLAVWVQDPKNADLYRAIGINTYVGLWGGPTEDQLVALKQAGIRAVCDQNEVGLRHLDDPTIVAWMHGDEPDNYQGTAEAGYTPAIPPSTIIADYNALRAKDPTRPVMLNLGQGVAHDVYKGAYASLSDYPEYMKGSDIVSFDIYPVASDYRGGADYLWMVAKGVDRLVSWGGGRKVVWNALECTQISIPGHKPTPEQVRSEVWMSIIHGSMGIIYFVHHFQPEFIEAGLLADPEMTAAVKAINQQILALAPILNLPTDPVGGSATSSNPLVPVDTMVKQQGDTVYMFAVGMRNLPAHAELVFDAVRKSRKNSTVEVVGENRTIPCWGGRFEDDFAPYQVHIYKTTVPTP
jgi:hypothetical protein